ncbi:MAG: pilus assembly protein TadG-related protein [Aliihoeflea sp.]
MARFSNILARFMSDRRGNFALLTGATLSMLAVGAGFGVNATQLMSTKSALQNALDAAVASTARDLTTGVIAENDARASVEAFLTANGGGAFAREGAITLETLTVDRIARTVEATARANIDLAFPLFGAERTRDVAATTASLYSDRKIEVAMMLDVTGSMAGQKIRDLKSAAANAVDALLSGQDERNPRVRVSIVPYAEAVNVGTLASSSVIFQERKGGSDLPPYLGASPRYVSDNTGSFTDNCATERKRPDLSPDYSDDSPMMLRDYPDNSGRKYHARINRDDRLATKDCPKATIVPLTADADALKRSINAFNAVGYTAGSIGIQWTQYMLSPEWRDTIRNARLGAGPADVDPRDVGKIAILMTDGQFNTVFAGGDPRQGVNAQGRAARTTAEALCDRMKADGVEIFTIGFDLDNRSIPAQDRRDAKAVLNACASDDTGAIKHYFEASTGPELDAAFQEIISNTERLFLTM